MSGERLLPCPFCGGEADIWEEYRNTWNVYCTRCGAETGYPAGSFPEAEAVAAWNRRFERTCRYVGDEASGGCSECRGWLDPGCSYCPSCGAKVVEG